MKRLYFVILLNFISIISVMSHELSSTNANQYVIIKKSWLDLNVVRDGVTGTAIHVSMEAHGYKGMNLNVTSFLDSPKGTPVKDTNGRYNNFEGNVCAFVELNNVAWDGTVWEDLVLFLPNDEIHPTPGEKEYFLHTFVFCDGKILGDIWSGSFFMKGPQQSSGGNQNNYSGNNINPQQEVQEANRRLGSSIFYYRICDLCNGYKNCVYCNGRGLCGTCNGSNVCTGCHGSGKVNHYALGWITCFTCGGNGQCLKCGYTGRCDCHRHTGPAGTCARCKGQGMIKELYPQYANGYVPAGGGGGNSSFNNNSGGGKIQCSSCGGTGRCRMCGGSGVSVGTDNYNCKTCYGTKKCPGCRGNGYY